MRVVDAGPSTSQLRVLVLSRNYPNPGLPLLGLWAQRLVHSATGFCQTKVVAPVPYVPPLVARFAPYFSRYKDVPRQRWDGDIEVFHPRLAIGPGQSLYAFEALSYAQAVLPTIQRMRRDFPFDVIHAHFTYPDGVAAVLLGRLYGIPVIITEHTLWLPWMRHKRLVRHQAAWAARNCSAHIAVSEAVRDHIGQITGDPDKVKVIPNVVDGAVFTRAQNQQRTPGQILFVGIVRASKGLDLLLHALHELRRARPEVRLKVVGEPFYRAYRQEADRLAQLTDQLGLADCVELVGGKSPADTAQLMAQSEVVVLPSRRESFGAVLIEALACGTPVVATRCGGPEDIVTPAVGRLVPPEDPHALASALAEVLDNQQAYASDALRRYALAHFGAPVVAQQLGNEYATLVGPAVRLNLHARLAAVSS